MSSAGDSPDAADAEGVDPPAGGTIPKDAVSARLALPVERMYAIVDAVVAIAMTILLLDIRIPAGLEAQPLREALSAVVPQLWAFALSVAVIGWFWRSHHVVMRHAARIDAPLVWFNFAFLALVSLIPFPTSVLEDYPKEPVAPAMYAVDIAAAAFVQAAMWIHLTRRQGPAWAPVTGLARVRPLLTSLIVGAVFLVSIPVAYIWSPTAAVYVWIAVPVCMGGVFLLLRRHGPTEALLR